MGRIYPTPPFVYFFLKSSAKNLSQYVPCMRHKLPGHVNSSLVISYRIGMPSLSANSPRRLKAAQQLTRQDELDRIPVEGKFGRGKRRFGLGRIMTKLAGTSATVRILNILVINLEKLLKAALSPLLFALWSCLYEAIQPFSALECHYIIIRQRLYPIREVVSIARCKPCRGQSDCELIKMDFFRKL